MLDDLAEETSSKTGEGGPDTKEAEALASALNHSAERVQTLWFSFLTFMVYLAIAAGTTTHRMLFLESPLNLPVLNIALPLLGFYILTPVIFVAFHFYMLLNLVLLARTAKSFEDSLARAFAEDGEARENFRMRIENTLFVQLLAGGRLEREGINAKLLSLMALITLAVAPVAVLLYLQIKFLPYHSEWITWLHRGLLGVDLLLVWTLWPGYRSGWGERLRPKASLRLALPGVLSAVALSYAVAVTTFPDERMYLATKWLHGESYQDFNTSELASRGSQLWYDWIAPVNSLDLHGQSLIDYAKLENITKKNKSETGENRWEPTLFLKNRDLTEANLTGADIRHVEFSDAILKYASFDNAWASEAHLVGAQLQGADLRDAALQGASLDRAQLQHARLLDANLQGASLEDAQLQAASLENANFQGASLYKAQLQGANLWRAQLQGALFDSAQLQGAALVGAHLQGAALNDARLQGASLESAQLQGASLLIAQLQGTVLDRAQLQGAYLFGVNLQGASLRGAELRGAFLGLAQLQGVSLEGTKFAGVLLDGFVWRAHFSLESTQAISGAFVQHLMWDSEYRPSAMAPRRPWSEASYLALKRVVEDEVVPAPRLVMAEILRESVPEEAWKAVDIEPPAPFGREATLKRISILDPNKPFEFDADVPKWKMNIGVKQLTKKDFEKYNRIADGELKTLACSGHEDALYIVRGLANPRSFYGPNPRLTAALIGSILSPACPVSAVLTEQDKANLRKLAKEAQARR